MGRITATYLIETAQDVEEAAATMAGVNHLHTNGLRNKFTESDESVNASVRACLTPMLGGYELMPVISSEQWAGQTVDTYRAIGSVDLMHLCGGGKSVFASDGDLWPVADDLFGASGVDGFYEIDLRAGMDLNRLRDAFPDLTLIGNISSHNLHRGTREEVIRETRTCVETAKTRRGIIVGISNMPVPGTPIENVHTMLETIEKHR